MILRSLILLFIILSFSVEASPFSCSSSIACEVTNSGRQGTTKTLSCSIPNMPNLSVATSNVFDSNGTLKTYWEAQNTVCDVMEWIDIAAEKRSIMQGMNVSLPSPETIVLDISQQADIRENGRAS